MKTTEDAEEVLIFRIANGAGQTCQTAADECRLICCRCAKCLLACYLTKNSRRSSGDSRQPKQGNPRSSAFIRGGKGVAFPADRRPPTADRRPPADRYGLAGHQRFTFLQ